MMEIAYMVKERLLKAIYPFKITYDMGCSAGPFDLHLAFAVGRDDSEKAYAIRIWEDKIGIADRQSDFNDMIYFTFDRLDEAIDFITLAGRDNIKDKPVTKHIYTIEVETVPTDYEAVHTKITISQDDKVIKQYKEWPAEVCYSMFRTIVLENDFSDCKRGEVDEDSMG